MFSRSDADALREQLGPIDFQQPTAESDLLSAYRNHYGLRFPGLNSEPEHHIGTFTSGDFTLLCQYFCLPSASSRGSVLLLHGYFDHAGLFKHLIHHCLTLGYSVVIFDLPGHGLSTGEPASIDSFQDYDRAFTQCLAIARNALSGPWAVIGQSTGGAIALDTLLHHAEELNEVDTVILLCPLLYPVNWNSSRLLYYLLRLFSKSSPRRFAANSHDEEFLRFLKNDDALQSLRLPGAWVGAMIDYQRRFARAETAHNELHIVQGTDDGTVDWQRNLAKIEKKFPKAVKHLIPDAKHHLVNESLPYRKLVFDKVGAILNSD